MWYCPIGSVLSFVAGWIFSWIFDLISKKERQELNPDLFTPILASRVRKRRSKNINEFHSSRTLEAIS